MKTSDVYKVGENGGNGEFVRKSDGVVYTFHGGILRNKRERVLQAANISADEEWERVVKKFTFMEAMNNGTMGIRPHGTCFINFRHPMMWLSRENSLSLEEVNGYWEIEGE